MSGARNWLADIEAQDALSGTPEFEDALVLADKMAYEYRSKCIVSLPWEGMDLGNAYEWRSYRLDADLRSGQFVSEGWAHLAGLVHGDKDADCLWRKAGCRWHHARKDGHLVYVRLFRVCDLVDRISASPYEFYL